MQRLTSIGLIVGIVVLLNLLSQQFFFRWDWTEGNQYTLSKATRTVLNDLEEPVSVRAYFSTDLPPDFEKVRSDFQDMLIEYANISKGMIEYVFEDPNESPETQQEAAQNGIRPLLINVREKDQTTQQKAFMGAILSLGDQEEVVPFIGPETPMEYTLTTAIKKIAVVDKPSIGFITGQGEPALQELGQAVEALSVIFTVESVDISTGEPIPDRFQALAWIRPQDSISGQAFGTVNAFLERGGNLFLAFNAVDGDFSTAQGNKVESDLFAWLATKGLTVEPSFIVDESCGSVTVQQKQGFFTFNTQVKFPYLPIIKEFPEHPVTAGIEQVIFQFASPVRFQGDTSASFTPIIRSSDHAGIIPAPTYFNVADKDWTQADFPQSDIVMGGVLEAQAAGGFPYKLIVVSDGDFPISGNQPRGINPDNINLLANGLEWLSDQSGLASLRTKGITSRPIEDLEDGQRSFLKYLNFFLPILLVLLFGIYRSQRNRSKRLRRMQESYA